MRRNFKLTSFVLLVCLIAAVTSISVSAERQDADVLRGLFNSNERLKSLTFSDRPLEYTSFHVLVDGIWQPESKDPSKALAFPIQVRIDCWNSRIADDRKCVAIEVKLMGTKNVVSVQEIGTEDYAVDSWDSDGLVASGGGDAGTPCQRRVITIAFKSGRVSLADIPTNKDGCEAFKETNSYRLVRGNYYVDTSPNNDMDKPAKK